MKIYIIYILLYSFIQPIYSKNKITEYNFDDLKCILRFPGAVKIKKSSASQFMRGIVCYPDGYVYIYVLISSEKNKLSWNRINNFDNNSKFGDFISDEELERIDGHLRTYISKDIYTYIALIRGNFYAFYLVESSRNKNQSKLKNIINSSIFTGSIKFDKKEKGKRSLITCLFIIFFILTCFFIRIKKYKNKSLKISFIISGLSISFILLANYLYLDWKESLGIISCIFILIIPIFHCKNFNDFLNYLENIR